MTAQRPEGTVARQQWLLDAAIQVVGANGLRGLTHRAVDRAAELPEGTCSVYYRTRLALLTALTEHVGGRLAGDVQGVADRLGDHVGQPEIAVEATIDLLLGWSDAPALLLTMSELLLESVRTPTLREPALAWRDNLVTIVESIVERSGKTRKNLRAQAMVASVQGVALSSLTVPQDERSEYLRTTLGLVMSGLGEADPIQP